jgi:hypothetical protein
MFYNVFEYFILNINIILVLKTKLYGVNKLLNPFSFTKYTAESYDSNIYTAVKEQKF